MEERFGMAQFLLAWAYWTRLAWWNPTELCRRRRRSTLWPSGKPTSATID